MPKRILYKSVGCRTNQEEMQELHLKFGDKGNSIAESVEEADLIVVNTCAVTSIAERKTRNLINSLKRQAPHTPICVTGCLVQHAPEQFSKSCSWVVGNTLKHKIPEIVDIHKPGLFFEKFDTSVIPFSDKVSPEDVLCSGRTRYTLKIQEGCNFECSYCIVPRLRGPSRSALSSTIVSRIEGAIEAGLKEIVISGTHIGQFSSSDGDDLFSLLKQIASIQGDFRIRLSSLDPRDLTDDLLSFLMLEPKICRHIHVSVQSLAPTVLQAMNRPTGDYQVMVERLASIRRRDPLFALGCDCIVGFPGEGPDDFLQTLTMVEQIGFTNLHLFRFSSRPGTPAALMENRVAPAEMTRRSLKLREMIASISDKFIENNIGSIQRIIVEKEGPPFGITSNYLKVRCIGADAKRHEWLSVKITGRGQQGVCVANPVNAM